MPPPPSLGGNRSAAYLSKGDGENALKDGEKCIEIDGAWAKGYVRKGAALHKLKRYDDAEEAYTAGLGVAPGDKALEGGIADVKKAMQAGPPGGAGGLGAMFGPGLMAKVRGPRDPGAERTNKTSLDGGRRRRRCASSVGPTDQTTALPPQRCRCLYAVSSPRPARSRPSSRPLRPSPRPRPRPAGTTHTRTRAHATAREIS